MTQIHPDDQSLIDGYLQHMESARGRRQRTLEAYGLALARLCEFLEGKPLHKASADELETFAGLWLHKRGVVARSRKPYVSAVRGFYAWAAKRGHVKADPAAGLEHPKTGRPLPRALSMASAEKLMWAPDLNTFRGIRDAAMLSVLLCGARVSGLVSLNEGDLRNTDIGGEARLVVHLVEKGERERVLPLSREAEMLVRIYLDHEELQAMDRHVVDRRGQPDKVLFVSMRNATVLAHEHRGELTRLKRQSPWRIVQAYGAKVGIPKHELHPHAFRHLFGTELAEEDVDLLMRQELMGHSDPKSTQIYTALSLRRKAKVIDQAGPLAKMKSPVSELLRRLPRAAAKPTPAGPSGAHNS